MKKITGKIKLNEVLEQNPNAAEILLNSGLHCIGCPMTMGETLEDGCRAHGMNKKEIEDLIKKINRESVVNQIQGKIKRKKPEVSAQ